MSQTLLIRRLEAAIAMAQTHVYNYMWQEGGKSASFPVSTGWHGGEAYKTYSEDPSFSTL